LMANFLLAKKKLEAWMLWIIVDVVYIGLFAYKGLYMSSGLYFIFLILAIFGLFKWIDTFVKNGEEVMDMPNKKLK